MAITTEDELLAGYMSPITFLKSTTTTKAAGIPCAMCLFSSGLPGNFISAAPGLSGATVDGTTSTLGGTLYFANPPAGQSTYLAKASVACGTTTAAINFFDLLWYNSGIVVTTTTAQTINSVTLPSRDMNGATNGIGVTAWLYCQTATTNASTITISYTNSSGVSGRTGTIVLGGWPAAATAGTFLPFSLQNGDVGVQSIQTITLGTSLAAGSVYLMLIREFCYIGFIAASTGMTLDWTQVGFPQLYNGTALSFFVIPTSTSVGILSGQVVYTQG